MILSERKFHSKIYACLYLSTNIYKNDSKDGEHQTKIRNCI